MKTPFTLKLIAACALATGATAAFSHDGHGMGGLHWHATDTWGFLVVAGLVTLAVWLGRGGK